MRQDDGLKINALDIAALDAVEVDTPDDLVRANASLQSSRGARAARA